MDENFLIETERLFLRPWRMEDIPDVVEGLNNLNVSKWLAYVPYPYTEDDAKNFIERSINNKLYNLAIVLKSENKVIGGTQISDINLIHGTASGGIWLNENYHGKGYAFEAFGARIQYAFEKLNIRRFENGYFKGNEKSHKMQLKLGYKDEGIKREKYISLSTGNCEDECITGLLKREFIDKNFIIN